MGRFLSLVWRELIEWRLVLLGGLIVGWIPWVATWMPAFERHPTDDLREGVAIFSSGLFLLGFLVVLGSSVVGRDLSEGRLRFFFARPVSAGMLWWAKLSAAFLLLLGTLALLLLPSADLLMDPMLELLTKERNPARPLLAPTPDYYLAHSWQDLPGQLAPPWRFLGALWVLLFALAAVHCFSSMVRMRSAWLVFDLFALGLAVAIALGTYGHLLREQALGPIVWLERVLLFLVPIAFLGAGWYQLRRGRGDPSNSHRCLSLALWPLVLIIVLGAAGWGRWVTSDTLADLEKTTFVETAPDGPWIMAGGITQGRAGKTTAFLLNTLNDQSVRLGGLDVAAWQFAFSGDGQRAVWAACEDLQITGCELWTLNLEPAADEPVSTGIPLEHFFANFSLNRDGTRLALYQLQKLAIYELPSGRLVNVFRTDQVRASIFLDNGRVRLYVSEENEDGRFHIMIREFDPESGVLETTGALPNLITGYHVHHSLAADTVLYWSQMPPRFAIAQGRSGEDLVVYKRQPPQAALLADGASILAFHKEGILDLQALSPAGELLHTRTVEGIERIVLGGELSPGRIVIGLKRSGSNTDKIRFLGLEIESLGVHGIESLEGLAVGSLEDWSAFLFDTSTGDLAEISQNLIPLRQSKFFRRLHPRTPESALGRLFQAGNNTVVYWDPDTGEVRRLLGKML